MRINKKLHTTRIDCNTSPNYNLFFKHTSNNGVGFVISSNIAAIKRRTSIDSCKLNIHQCTPANSIQGSTE